MFSRTFVRTTLGAVFAATLLVPAAHSDTTTSGGQVTLDTAIATAIHDRPAANATGQLDPAIGAAIGNRASETRATVALDPAIRAALRERASASPRPDDLGTARGPGSLPQPAAGTTGVSLDWSLAGIGGGVMLAALLGFASLLLIRHGRTRVTSA